MLLLQIQVKILACKAQALHQHHQETATFLSSSMSEGGRNYVYVTKLTPLHKTQNKLEPETASTTKSVSLTMQKK